MSQRMNTRRSLRLTNRRTAEPVKAPMSGAGGNPEEDKRRSELYWAKLEHAVSLALNYFKRRPIPIEQEDLISAFVLERAQRNWAKVGGDPDDYIVYLHVNAIPQTELSECVQKSEPTISVSRSVSIDALDQLLFETGNPIDQPTTSNTDISAAAGGGGYVC
jgi:hypothetical protein